MHVTCMHWDACNLALSMHYACPLQDNNFRELCMHTACMVTPDSAGIVSIEFAHYLHAKFTCMQI